MLDTQEWILLGHQFKLRLHKESRENSPIFLQFIEVVRIIRRHSPRAFQFDEQLLVDILDEATAPRTTTFLFDNVRDRRLHKIPKARDLFAEIAERAGPEPAELEDIDLDGIGVEEFDVWFAFYERPVPYFY